MRIYEIVLDGELTADLSDSAVPVQQRQEGGSTVLSFAAPDPDTLARVLGLLESLGIGVTAMQELDDPPNGRH